MMTILSSIFGGIFELVGMWFNNKKKEQQAKAEAKLIKIQAEATIATKKATAEIDWDQAAIEASSSSWKDEYLLLILTAPLIMAFIPDMQQYVITGFSTINTYVPEWYQMSVGVMVASSFGIRSVVKYFRKDNK